MTGWIRSSVAAVAMMATPAAAQRGSVEVLTERDAAQTVRVPAGTEIVVQLEQAAGTPFRWDMRNDPRLRLIGPPRTEDAAEQGRAYGGRQLRTFRVRATEPGRIPMIFGLRSQIAAGDQTPSRRVVFTLEVTGARGSEWSSDPEDAPRPPATDGTLREWDAGRVLPVRAGREMRILLPDDGNHLAFSWESKEGVGVAVTRSSTDDLRLSRSDGNIGRLGTEVIRVKIVRPGPADLTLEYRPGGPKTRPVRVLRYSFLAE